MLPGEGLSQAVTRQLRDDEKEGPVGDMVEVRNWRPQPKAYPWLRSPMPDPELADASVGHCLPGSDLYIPV